MRRPPSLQRRGRIEIQRVATRRRYEHPPHSVVSEECRIHEAVAAQQPAHELPLTRETGCAIQPDREVLRTLWNHVVVTFPLENVRIRQVERLIQRDTTVSPRRSVGAGRETNVALAAGTPDDLEEHRECTVPDR